jgi:hypothetical protein
LRHIFPIVALARTRNGNDFKHATPQKGVAREARFHIAGVVRAQRTQPTNVPQPATPLAITP